MSERYGTQRPGRRRGVIFVSGLVGVLALGWLAWVIVFEADPDVQSSMPRYTVVDPHTVRADIVVDARNDSVVANCVVRAFAVDHSVVGEANVRVTGAGHRTIRTVVLRTERAATSVELVGCTTPRQKRPR